MAGKQMYINEAHRQLLLDWCEFEHDNINSEIGHLRDNLHWEVLETRAVRDKKPKRSDFSDLLPQPMTDFELALGRWQATMNRPMQTVKAIRNLQAKRRQVLDLEAKLNG